MIQVGKVSGVGFNAQKISRFDNAAPPSPDGASGRQGEVLRQGELFGRPREVADSGNHKGPLCSITDPPVSGTDSRYYSLLFLFPPLPSSA